MCFVALYSFRAQSNLPYSQLRLLWPSIAARHVQQRSYCLKG